MVYLAEWVVIYFVGDVYILIFSPTFSIARNRITDFLLINVSVYSFSHRLPLTYTLVHFFLRRKAFLWRFEARNANWKIACDRLAFLMTNGSNGPCLINGGNDLGEGVDCTWFIFLSVQRTNWKFKFGRICICNHMICEYKSHDPSLTWYFASI